MLTLRKLSLIIILFTLLVSSGCYNKKIPNEAESFTSNQNPYWWHTSCSNTGVMVIGLVEKCEDHYKLISVSLAGKEFPNKYNDFQIKAYEISFRDSRQGDEGIFWMKKESLNEPFTDPRKYKVVDVVSEEFLKQDFDNSKKDMSINKKRIGSFKSIDLKSYVFQDWVCFKTNYNLKGAKGGVPVKRSKGELILLISRNNDKLREAYITEGQWSFIRHVEIGRLGLNISNTNPDPYELLELIWRAWNSQLKPFTEQIEIIEKEVVN